MQNNEPSLLSRRISISSYFFFFGFTFATWASRIPAIQQRLHLSEAELGAVLLSMPVGSFLALPFSGYFSSTLGSRKVAIFSAIAYCALLVAIGFSEQVWLLTMCLFLFGAAGNMLNIAINTQAIALETFYKRVIISSFHGVWSVAGLIAASIGTFLIAKAFPVSFHFLSIAIVSFACFLLAAPHLIIENVQRQKKGRIFATPDRALWGLGIIAFCSLICQGAMFDWSSVYFKKVVTTNISYIGFGYTAFMISMTAFRFLTDWITHHIGFKKIMIICGMLSTAGLLMAVFLPYVVTATIGLFLVGMGVSPAVPLVFSAAGKFKKLSPPVAIAAVSSIGMIGLLTGPPVIGFIAGLSNLKTSFLVLSLFAVAIIITTIMMKKPE